MEPKNPPAAVMDVVSPPAAEQSASLAREVDPLDKLAAEDRAEQQAHAKHEPATAKPAKPAKVAKSKQSPSDNGIRMAIIGTIIIVLGLAALATYAYLQTAK